MATLDDIIREQNTIHEELERIAADPDTTEEKDGNMRDTLVSRWKELDEDRAKIVARMEELELIRKAAADPANREAGSDGGGPGRWEGRSPQFMMRPDPFTDLDQVKRHLVTGSEMVSRAQTAIEYCNRASRLPERFAEEATRKVTENPQIARHVLIYGGDEYYDAFREYLNDPTGEGLQRAAGALSMVPAQGGYMIPFTLDPTIVLTTDGTTNPYRRLASVKQTTTNAWQGVNSAGVQAAYLDEAASASTAAYSGVGQIQIGVKKAAAWIYGSLEANEDTSFADQLPRLLQDGKDILEEQNFAAGTGGTALNAGAPSGIAFSLGTAQRVVLGTPGGAWVAQDVYNLEAALGPRFRLNPSVGFVSNITNINKVRGLSPSGAGSSFWATLGDGTPSRLLNHVIEESPSITSTGTTGTAATGTGSAALVFGAWENFLVVDRIGVSMLFEPLIKDPTSGAPKGQQGWFYYWRSGSGIATANAFRYLTIG
jgi:HK97 family phage major capsid protein